MNRTERERGVTVGGFAKRLIQLANFRAKVLPAETLLFPLRFRGNTARGNTAREATRSPVPDMQKGPAGT